MASATSIVSGASTSCRAERLPPTQEGISGSTFNRPLRHRIVSSQMLMGESHNSFGGYVSVLATRLERRSGCSEAHSQMWVSSRYFILSRRPNLQDRPSDQRCPPGFRPCLPYVQDAFLSASPVTAAAHPQS